MSGQPRLTHHCIRGFLLPDIPRLGTTWTIRPVEGRPVPPFSFSAFSSFSASWLPLQIRERAAVRDHMNSGGRVAVHTKRRCQLNFFVFVIFFIWEQLIVVDLHCGRFGFHSHGRPEIVVAADRTGMTSRVWAREPTRRVFAVGR